MGIRMETEMNLEMIDGMKMDFNIWNNKLNQKKIKLI